MSVAFETLPGPLGATPEELAALSSDALLVLLEEEPPDARALYYRWERQQWEAGAVDLSSDVQEWSAFDTGLQDTILALLSTWVFEGGSSQESLVAFADAVSSEDDQVFMTTELADAARHAVAYERLFDDVLKRKEEATANRALESLQRSVRECANETVAAPASPAPHRGLFLHNVVGEGILGALGSARLLDVLKERHSLRGLRTILAASFRDYARHALFATGWLRAELEKRDSLAGELEPVAREAASSIADIYNVAGTQSTGFEGAGFEGWELRDSAMEFLSRRLQDLGLDLP